MPRNARIHTQRVGVIRVAPESWCRVAVVRAFCGAIAAGLAKAK